MSPGWCDEPGPMGLAPGPPPLVPVGGLNRDQRLPFNPDSSHELGPINCLYIPLAREQSTPSALFFVAGEGRALWCSSSPPMHMRCSMECPSHTTKAFSSPSSTSKLHFPQYLSRFSGPSRPVPVFTTVIARADLIAGTTVVSLLFLSSFRKEKKSYLYVYIDTCIIFLLLLLHLI